MMAKELEKVRVRGGGAQLLLSTVLGLFALLTGTARAQTTSGGTQLARTGSQVNQTALWAVALAVAGLLLVALGPDGPAREPQSQGKQA